MAAEEFTAEASLTGCFSSALGDRYEDVDVAGSVMVMGLNLGLRVAEGRRRGKLQVEVAVTAVRVVAAAAAVGRQRLTTPA